MSKDKHTFVDSDLNITASLEMLKLLLPEDDNTIIVNVINELIVTIKKYPDANKNINKIMNNMIHNVETNQAILQKFLKKNKVQSDYLNKIINDETLFNKMNKDDLNFSFIFEGVDVKPIYNNNNSNNKTKANNNKTKANKTKTQPNWRPVGGKKRKTIRKIKKGGTNYLSRIMSPVTNLVRTIIPRNDATIVPDNNDNIETQRNILSMYGRYLSDNAGIVSTVQEFLAFRSSIESVINNDNNDNNIKTRMVQSDDGIYTTLVDNIATIPGIMYRLGLKKKYSNHINATNVSKLKDNNKHQEDHIYIETEHDEDDIVLKEGQITPEIEKLIQARARSTMHEIEPIKFNQLPIIFSNIYKDTLYANLNNKIDDIRENLQTLQKTLTFLLNGLTSLYDNKPLIMAIQKIEYNLFENYPLTENIIGVIRKYQSIINGILEEKEKLGIDNYIDEFINNKKELITYEDIKRTKHLKDLLRHHIKRLIRKQCKSTSYLYSFLVFVLFCAGLYGMFVTGLLTIPLYGIILITFGISSLNIGLSHLTGSAYYNVCMEKYHQNFDSYQVIDEFLKKNKIISYFLNKKMKPDVDIYLKWKYGTEKLPEAHPLIEDQEEEKKDDDVLEEKENS